MAAHPIVYNSIQWAAGRDTVYRHVRRLTHDIAHGIVLDVGGGTGSLKPQLNQSVRHVCLDLERPKLVGYVRKYADACPLMGDATLLPVRTGVVDMVALSLVTHHLSDAQLDTAFAEAARVLRSQGAMFVCDAVWAPSRPIGRLLWRHDRGSFPRTADQIASALERRFQIVEREAFAVFHAYTAFLCRPRLPS
jgi:ubiquinone/menaquinone biosynthesis C-methylase UbiE